MNSHVSFFCEFDFFLLGSSGHHVLVLDAHNIASPSSLKEIILIVVGFEAVLQISQVLEVFFLHFSQTHTSSSLLVHQLSQSCLSLNETERNTLLSAESRKEYH